MGPFILSTETLCGCFVLESGNTQGARRAAAHLAEGPRGQPVAEGLQVCSGSRGPTVPGGGAPTAVQPDSSLRVCARTCGEDALNKRAESTVGPQIGRIFWKLLELDQETGWSREASTGGGSFPPRSPCGPEGLAVPRTHRGTAASFWVRQLAGGSAGVLRQAGPLLPLLTPALLSGSPNRAPPWGVARTGALHTSPGRGRCSGDRVALFSRLDPGRAPRVRRRRWSAPPGAGVSVQLQVVRAVRVSLARSTVVGTRTHSRRLGALAG